MNRRFFLKETDQRSSLIQKNIILSFLIKGWSAIVVFLLVPFTLKCLGSYENGIWMMISSLLVWIDQFDIGIGNGLRNKLAEYMAKKDYEKAKEAISSAIGMLIFLIIPITIVLCLFIQQADIYEVLNIDPKLVPDLKNVLMVSIILVCSAFILKFIGTFYLGLQLPFVNNLLVTCGQTLALITTIFMYYAGMHSLMLITLANTIPPLLVYIFSYHYTFFQRYSFLRPSCHAFSLRSAKDLCLVGIQFFFIQIAGGILFLSSNVLISRLFNPAQITPYQITYRYFSIILLVFTIISTPYWTATTDAYQRNDMLWIIKSGKFLNRILLAFLLGIIIMVSIAPTFYSVWIGKEIEIPFGMTLMMALFSFIIICSLRYSIILNGLGLLRIQVMMSLLAAITFVPLSIFVTQSTHSIVGFMFIMSLVNLPGLFLNFIQYRKVINKTATGIWMK